MFWKFRQVGGAVWQYLNQPLFSEPQIAVWKPRRFWYSYKIEHLEQCWRKSTSQSHSSP